MAYALAGKKRSFYFMANPRTGSTSVANALTTMGAVPKGDHHDDWDVILPDSIVAQTVRHHCDVLVSFWFKSQIGSDFTKFVEAVLGGEYYWLPSTGFYNRWGDKVNCILRYETLEYELNNALSCCGIPPVKLERTVTRRSSDVSWQSLFSMSLYEKVADHYHAEMKEFGYGYS